MAHSGHLEGRAGTIFLNYDRLTTFKVCAASPAVMNRVGPRCVAGCSRHMPNTSMGTPGSQDRRQLARAVIASTIGTTIEWYDFFLYSSVTGLVFARLYFPNSEPLVGTLQ